jgi:hypothetical protein
MGQILSVSFARQWDAVARLRVSADRDPSLRPGAQYDEFFTPAD